jgi:hypothetical protein
MLMLYQSIAIHDLLPGNSPCERNSLYPTYAGIVVDKKMNLVVEMVRCYR